MKRFTVFMSLLLPALVLSPSVSAEPLIWGVTIDRLEHRATGRDQSDAIAWEGNAVIGTDELKFALRSEGEFLTKTDRRESMETQFRLQKPISKFFDAVAGVRLATPNGRRRTYDGVLGIQGLAPQWFEINADLFLSNKSSARFEVEYEALITNYLILTPSIELDVPLRDFNRAETEAWGPKLEIGARLRYDLVDRAIAPYVGVHYERVFGDTLALAEADGREGDGLFFVTGVRLMF